MFCKFDHPLPSVYIWLRMFDYTFSFLTPTGISNIYHLTQPGTWSNEELFQKLSPPRIPTDTLLEMCYQKIHESNRVSSTSSKYQTSTNNPSHHQDLENYTTKVKNENLKLERAIQQMQATIPRSREADPANARRLHENAIQVVQQTLRNTSERLADLRSGMYNRDYDTRRLVRRVVDRLSGQVPAWGRRS